MKYVLFTTSLLLAPLLSAHDPMTSLQTPPPANLQAAIHLSRAMMGTPVPLTNAQLTAHLAQRPVSAFATLPARVAAKVGRKAKQPFDKPDEAQAWFLYQRTKGAPLDYALLEAGLRDMNSLRGSESITSWSELGPGTFGGRTRAMIIDPENPDRLFSAGVAGGVWRTTNGGDSWTALDDMMDNLAVTCLEFGRTAGKLDTQIIYAGTGEGFANPDGIRGAGIFKSLDGGDTWTRLSATNTSDFRFVNKIRAGLNHPDRVYAATQTGLFRSENAGASWTRVQAPGTSGDLGFTDLTLTTLGGEDLLLAASGSLSGDGVYRSTDSGDTWSRVLDSGDAPNIGRTTLAFAPSDPTTAYALVAASFNGQLGRLVNLYRSTDSGATWTARISGTFDPGNVNWLLLTNPLQANLDTCFPGFNPTELHQGWYDNIIAVAPHDPDVVYVGGIDLFRSDDGGSNFGLAGFWWVTPHVSPGYLHADNHIIQFHPDWNGSSNQTMFVGNDGGLYRSTNAMGATESNICYDGSVAITWQHINNGYNITQFYAGRPLIETSGGSPAYFGGTQDNGTPYGSDAGGPNTWNDLLSGDGGYVHYDPANTNVLIGENTNLSIKRTTLGPTATFTNFESISNGIASSGSTTSKDYFAFITAFRADPSNPDRIWIGSTLPWRSNNAVSAPTASAVTWSQAGAPLSGGLSRDVITAWAIDPNNSDVVYAGTESGAIFKVTNAVSSDASTVWQNISTGFTGSFVSWLEVDPGNSNTVYATNSVYDGQGKVFKTTDGGMSGWTDITANLPAVPAHCIVVSPNDSNTLFVGMEVGVLVSTDGGSSWTSSNPAGLPNTVVESLEFLEGRLYAFTHGRGVWRGELDQCIQPTITAQDGDATACAGAGISFSVTATGTEPGFQWSLDDQPIAGATQAVLTLTNLGTSDAGTYRCTVTNSCGTATSDPIDLTILDGVSIQQQPASITACEGDAASFAVTVDEPGVGYQWQFNGGDLPGENAAVLTLSSVIANNAGAYACVVTGACGQTTSSDATLTVDPATSISAQPQSASPCVGQDVALSVTASGSALSYQWRKDGAPITGATSSSLSLSGVTPTDSGDYDCLVSGACGQITSATATVAVATASYDPSLLPLWRGEVGDSDCRDFNANGFIDIADYAVLVDAE